MQSIASPVLSTALYFVVFGAAIGARMGAVDGVRYGSFIVPGLVMLSILSESVSNASFGIYLPKFTGTIYEVLSAPISAIEIVIGFVGAAATKSLMLGLVMLATARLFVDFMMSDAQQIIQKNNEYSLRKDVKPPDGMPPLQSLKSLPLDIDKALAEQSELLAWWRQTTGVK